jgi:hypothetical protein
MGINSVDDFLSHRSTERSGGFLSGWKKDGKVDTWMVCLPVALWRHGGVPRVVVVENKTTKENETRVWSGNWSCHETEDVLKKQYKRDEEKNRVAPPNYCALCRLTDVMFHLVTSGRVDWLKPIFKFEGDEAKETKVLHAGGMWMSRKSYEELEKDELKRAKDAGVSLKEMSWQENCFAKMEYVARVVDNAHPESGVQIATVTSSLGDKIKDVIVDQREDRGVEEGDPFKNPYAIQWEFREREPVPANMYKVRPMLKLPLTPAINALLQAEPPDISKMVQPFNTQEMRAFLESHALVKLPWDDIFNVQKRIPKAPESLKDVAPPKTKSTQVAVPEDLEEPKPSKAVQKAKPARPAIPSEDDPKAVNCAACGTDDDLKPMWEDDTTCPHCGAKYTASGDLIPREEAAKPKMRKRGENGTAETTKTAPKEMEDFSAPVTKTKVKAPAQREPGDDTEENEDDLPF